MSVQDKLVKAAKYAGGAAVGGLATAYWLDKNYFIAHDFAMMGKVLKLRNGIMSNISAGRTFADIWEENVAANPKKTMMLFEGYAYTYKDIDRLANQIARWAKAKGVKAGDHVALFMHNRPEYVAFWLGILKLGGVAALINFNIKGKPLLHSLSISGAKLLIVGSEVMGEVAKVSAELIDDGFEIWAWGEPGMCKPMTSKVPPPLRPGYVMNPTLPNGWSLLDGQLEGISGRTVNAQIRKGRGFNDSALLVYTSGTTGLPKAATIQHKRLFSMGAGFSLMFQIRPDDRVYCVLPLYHSAGGLCGVGMTIVANATMVLRRSFSATQFIPECRKYKVTVVQYIGELCRYLLAVPPTPDDTKNMIRLAVGNGLRPEIWNDLQTRFGIEGVGEFYGSTEGTVALFNYCTKAEDQGAVGRMGPLMMKMSNYRLVKFDVEKEEIVRGKDGFAIDCAYNEPGELLGFLDSNDPMKQFDGYHGNKEATAKKVASDVFVKGDMYFRSGDLLSRNEKGYWYFVDRIGDTFRWKGENVSTNEVGQVVSVFPGVSEVNIYGAAIPGTDGRACMAALVADEGLNFAALASHCMDNLPNYAVPVFIRLLPKIEVTSTFKHQKVALRKEGADPSDVSDALLILDAKAKNYVPLTAEKWGEVVRGNAKL